MNINFPKVVDRTRWESVGDIIAEANEIAKNRKSGRTQTQVYEDSINGLTLQYAIAQALIDAGYNLRLAPKNDKSFDFEIDAIRFDVKGMFKESATAFTQSTWEKLNALPNTIYVCYDCRGDTCEYAGWCKHGDFMVSKIRDYCIFPNRLN